MGKKAVDIVLLPDEAMSRRAIEANARLVERFGARLVLGRDAGLPHISLAMGCIDESDMGVVEGQLSNVGQEHPLGLMRVVGMVVGTNSIGEKVSLFEVESSDRLQRLHEAVMNEFGAYLSAGATREMMYQGREVEESSLLWIRNYGAKASFENFFPHITIGYGECEQGGFPVEFGASKLAICHLGNHCTCRQVLATAKL